MKPAEIPADEDERMAALHELDILDTDPEAVFDRLTRLASRIIDAPIFLISFLDGERNWFKSTHGIELDESPRDISFCGHAIHSDDIMIVPDASADDRFADNPLVTGPFGVRFYAGAPLILGNGHRLGTLCAFDTKPNQLDPEQQEALADLAAVVVDELGLRRGMQVQEEITIDLREQAVELEHANQALEQYVHMASHDLRSPVKNLVNLADLAVIDTEGSLRELVTPLRDSAVRLEELLLGYGRLAALSRGPARSVVLPDLVTAAVAESGLTAHVKGDARLECDAVLVEQALVNLFQNVVKYGADDDVMIELAEDETAVSIAVRNRVDQNLAVDQTVFTPFKRLVSEGSGSGLGLAIVDRVVQLHGGSASASCVGSVFSVVLRFPTEDVR